ncbi:MAG: hypothetical protein ACRCUM_00490 [Mycoplasmoidaceae bacterium]
MSKKIKIEINKSLYDSLLDRYEKEKLSLVAINVNNAEEFIEYILKNFDASSKQFENLSENQKSAFSNMDLSNIDLNDLVKKLTDSLGEPKNEDLKKEIKKSNNVKN